MSVHLPFYLLQIDNLGFLNNPNDDSGNEDIWDIDPSGIKMMVTHI